MKNKLALALVALFAGSSGRAETIWAHLDGNGAVIGFYRNAAPVPSPTNCCTPLDVADARVVAYLNSGPSPQRQYMSAVAAGVQITSSSTPGLAGTYAIDDGAITKITAEQVYIATKGTFTNGQLTRGWLDQAGNAHLFASTSQFTTFAEAIATYLDNLVTVEAALQSGQSVSWPSKTVSIP